MNIACRYCATPLNPNQAGVYERVTGWARKRNQGGTNQVSLPERTGEYACRLCIDMRTRGLITDEGQQLSLFE